ncbi:integrase [Methylobacterium sp. BE186]|uniref:tyrosine-type recombinase/integrase n=1 Tax=Methylobacterium sp. BE186 TaxID=2817715 RepID=UPI002867A5FF|nr:tyrosine-type recombinase/integrase [Methylobacterium sp. BE186]MDR7040428.1 integrase [Methylobacterium sp. BE186]
MTVAVPARLVKVLGATRLKEPLNATTLAEADAMKWPALGRLKQRIADADAGRPSEGAIAPIRPVQRANIAREAMEWRREVEEECRLLSAGTLTEDGVAFLPIVDLRIDRIAEEDGSDDASLFAHIVSGRATPFASLVDHWLHEGAFAGRTEAAYRQAIRDLTSWCEHTNTPPTVEAITKRVAGQFIRARFIDLNAAPATANKAITALASFWGWLHKRGHIGEVSPWSGQSLSKAKRPDCARDPGEAVKRAFTDDEVATLLNGLTDPLIADFCRFAALTGMRREEIATLRVRHVRSGIIKVPGTKTVSAAREVPLHSDLVSLVDRRITGKGVEDFVFHELPPQTSKARGRGAPITQAFTRQRRKLGVEDRFESERQSRVDLHSFRRWFSRKAQEALEAGGVGFTDWTISDVLGHSRENRPGGMTMGRYAGSSDMKAKRSCIEAVRLPLLSKL